MRNTGEGLIYSVEQALEEYGNSLDETEAEEVAESLSRARKALAEDDPDELRDAVEDLQQLAFRMTEAVYERMQGGEDNTSS